MKLTGIWKKISKDDCGKKYPGSIQFQPNGLYQAQADPDATLHPLWDVGTFTAAKKKLEMSTSNDAVISYGCSLKDNILTITDADGCTVKYKAEE